MLASGVCTACCHNKGDKMEIKDGGPCLDRRQQRRSVPAVHVANKDAVKLFLAKGGAPTVAEMER